MRTCASPPNPLLRYLLISCVIVLAAVIVVAGYANRERLGIKIKSVYAPVPPKPVTPFAPGPRHPGSFIAQAPWALSALPECFEQTTEVSGPRSYVVLHIPAGARPVAPGSRVVAGDCLVFSHGDSVWVWRGRDRLQVPPPSYLYEKGRTLALLARTANAYILRIYQMDVPLRSR